MLWLVPPVVTRVLGIESYAVPAVVEYLQVAGSPVATTKLAEVTLALNVPEGIPSETIDKMMQPFFTTKGVGKGTGLGLTIVKDVVEELRGRVEAESHGELGGAAFTITLPLKT